MWDESPWMEIPKSLTEGPVRGHMEFLKRFILGSKNEGKELEMRLGRIVGKEDHARMKMDVVAPVVLRSLPLDYRFESAVDAEDFRKLKVVFSSCTSETKSDVIVVNEDGRETYENNVLKRVERKLRSEKLDIYIPGKKYDVRLVLSEEAETFKQASKKKALVRRSRQRETYLLSPYGFDFTEVSVCDERDERRGGKKFEVEVEVLDPDKLVSTEFVSLIHNFNIDLPSQQGSSRRR